MSRSLKAVIKSVMDVFFFLQSFAYDIMELCCVYFSKVNYKGITQKVEHINRKMRKLEKAAEFFCSSKCHRITDIVWT